MALLMDGIWLPDMAGYRIEAMCGHARSIYSETILRKPLLNLLCTYCFRNQCKRSKNFGVFALVFNIRG